MSARSRRRRARAEGLPETTKAARPALRLPAILLIASGAGLLLLATAWTTTWSPGPPRTAARPSHFTLEIPQIQQATINSWERFFICYDLLDPQVIDLTLRANQRATGTLDFPRDKVEVALPSPAAPQEQAASSTGAEDELIAARQSILGAAVPERLALVRQQCAGGTGG